MLDTDVKAAEQAKGTGLVVSAAMTFAVVGLVIKQDPLPSTVAAEARFFACWMLSVAFMLRYRATLGLFWFGPTEIRWALILRGFCTCGFVSLWWAALPMAPLGDCVAVVYCAPLITVVLSWFLLGEAVRLVFPLQAFLAIIGMVLILKPPFLLAYIYGPSADTSGADYSLVLAAMIINAVMPVVTSKTRQASWIEVEHVTNVLAVLILNPAIFLVKLWLEPDSHFDIPDVKAGELALIVMAGLGSFLGVAMQTKGYQLADAGKASMFCYLEIPFAYFLQLVGTATPASSSSLFGASLIVSSCLIGAVAEYKAYQRQAMKEAHTASLATKLLQTDAA